MPKRQLGQIRYAGVRSQESCGNPTEYALVIRVPFLSPILISNIMTITYFPSFPFAMSSVYGSFSRVCLCSRQDPEYDDVHYSCITKMIGHGVRRALVLLKRLAQIHVGASLTASCMHMLQGAVVRTSVTTTTTKLIAR